MNGPGGAGAAIERLPTPQSVAKCPSGPEDADAHHADGETADAPPRKRSRRRRGRRGKGQSKDQSKGQSRVQSGEQTELQPKEQVAKAPRSRKARPGHAPSSDALYAALDLGTNNCRLLIARRALDGFTVVDSYSRIVRLGEGLAKYGVLGDAAMARAIDALKICADKMARRGVKRARMIATAACRTAVNGTDFIERVKRETGLALEIVSTEDEARLAVAGCAPLLDRTCASALVFDIGGGSTELIWVRMRGAAAGARERKPEIGDWISLPCGVVTLAERYGGLEVPGNIYARMVAEVAGQLQPFLERVAAEGGMENFHLLGTSGTVTTIAGVHLGLERYDRTRVDGIWISPADVDRVTRSLLEMTYANRAAHPCVGHDRADLVLAGCAIFEAIADAWPADRLRVADRGLREGILLSLMEADARRRKRRRRRRRKTQQRTQEARAASAHSDTD
ncbi:MAG: Ppx/GppA phosphatase [Alphaproteobacteria bacterium HGW-Alphaproteobacteria-12]|nr:MAG: Ppx/GppA phosphatase [Alphaproteobacteria bacterium HGW-Alphaproteobacteria-12]